MAASMSANEGSSNTHFQVDEEAESHSSQAFAGPADTYKPLDEDNLEIRLLEVAPGNPEDEVRCYLRTVTLKAATMPEYLEYNESMWTLWDALPAVGLDPTDDRVDILRASDLFRLPGEDVFQWGDQTEHIQHETSNGHMRLCSACDHTDALAIEVMDAYEKARRHTKMMWPRFFSVVKDEYIPPYVTISYCWGDAKLRGTINLDGQLVDVPASSEAAIRAVRKQEGDYRSAFAMWIDSVCINQYDVDEKTKQVARMSDIYKRGDSNVVYLGEDLHEKAAEQLAILNRVLSRIRRAENSLKDEAKMLWRNIGRLPGGWEYSHLVTEADMDRLIPLYSLPWFSRVWTLQEAALSPKSACVWGRTEMLSLRSMLIPAAIWGRRVSLQRSLPEPKSYFQRANDMYHLIIETACPDAEFHQLASWELHGAIVSREATDLRDHVFGLHGLVASGFMQPLGPREGTALRHAEVLRLFAPDYRKSLREVYRDATRAVLLARGDDILLNIALESNSELESRAPSWSVRWDQDQPLSVLFSENCKAGTPQSRRPRLAPGFGSQEGSQRLEIELDSHPDVLIVSGFLLGPVTWTGESLARLKGDLAAGDPGSLDSLIAELQYRSQMVHEFPLTPHQRTEIAMDVILCGELAYRGIGYEDMTTAGPALVDLRLELQKDDMMVDKVFAGWLNHQASVELSPCCGSLIPTVWLQSGRCRNPDNQESCRYCHGPSLSRLEQALGPLMESGQETLEDEPSTSAAQRSCFPAEEGKHKPPHKAFSQSSERISKRLPVEIRSETSVDGTEALADHQKRCSTAHPELDNIIVQPRSLSVRPGAVGQISTSLRLTAERERSAADIVDVSLPDHFRPFAIGNGHLGCGPSVVRPGDQIFIIRGGKFPHLVRPDGDHFRYLGAAYVKGLMHGEVFELGLDPRPIAIR